jgi:hypothetical protein
VRGAEELTRIICFDVLLYKSSTPGIQVMELGHILLEIILGVSQMYPQLEAQFGTRSHEVGVKLEAKLRHIPCVILKHPMLTQDRETCQLQACGPLLGNTAQSKYSAPPGSESRAARSCHTFTDKWSDENWVTEADS